MVFIEETLKFLGLGNEITPYPHRVTILGTQGGLVEGVKRIVFYSPTEVWINLKKGDLKIMGENLKIKKYGDGEIALVGKITGVCYQ